MRYQPAQAQPCRRHPRYDKLAVRYEATVHIAAINEWLRPGFPDTP
jgi:transposase